MSKIILIILVLFQIKVHATSELFIISDQKIALLTQKILSRKSPLPYLKIDHHAELHHFSPSLKMMKILSKRKFFITTPFSWLREIIRTREKDSSLSTLILKYTPASSEQEIQVQYQKQIDLFLKSHELIP